jgi:hypothetical protein
MRKLVQFTVTVEVNDAGDLDTYMMRDGIEGILSTFEKDIGALLPLDAESKIISYSVAHASTQPA